MFYFETPYLDMYRTKYFKSKPKPIVLHQRTCPICGRKLVNVYYLEKYDGYVCKKCMDKPLGEKGGKDNA